jgi:hypothetical protein
MRNLVALAGLLMLTGCASPEERAANVCASAPDDLYGICYSATLGSEISRAAAWNANASRVGPRTINVASCTAGSNLANCLITGT